MWLSESSIEKASYRQLPQIVNRLKNALISQKIKKEQNLLQLEHYKQNIEYEVELNKEHIRNQINKRFDDIIEKTNYARSQWLYQAEEQFQTYSNQLQEAFAQLEEIEKDIKGDICFIDYLSEDKNFKNHNFKGVNNIGSITDYYGTVINQWKKSTTDFFDKIPFIDSTLSFESDEKVLLKLNKLLNESYSFITENKFKTLINKEIDDCFNISKYWFWPTWKTKNSQESNNLQCLEWRVYKPIELYESFFSNKRYATFNDIKLLQKRKEMEKEWIIEKNKNNNDEVKTYFFIDENWMKTWEIFSLSKITEYNLQSTHSSKEVFYTLWPGPISNQTLLNSDNSIRDDISITSFRVVNSKVWNSLYFIYKGGPEIHRLKPSVYSPAADKNVIGDKMRKKINQITQSNLQKTKLILELKEKSNFIKQSHFELKQKYDSIIQVFYANDSVNSSDSLKTADEENEAETNEFKYSIIIPDLVSK